MRQDTNTIPRPLCGDNAGTVWGLDQPIFTKDGNGYRGEFQTPHFDFSWVDPVLATLRKSGAFLEVVAEPVGNWDLSVDVLWDGALTQTIVFNLNAPGAALGSFVLGSSILGEGDTLTVRHRLLGGGRRLSLRFYNTAANQNFSISRAYVSFIPADETIR